MNPIAIVVGVIALIGILVLIGAVKIVRPYQRGLVERLGKYKATKNPGLNLILPFIETMQLIDMREQVVDVPPQEVITQDNVVVSVDAVVYYEATDPQRLVYNVADFFTAITKLAQTNLRNLIGDLELDRALTSRDTINTQLRTVLDDATGAEPQVILFVRGFRGRFVGQREGGGLAVGFAVELDFFAIGHERVVTGAITPQRFLAVDDRPA